ncbi:MAG: polyhydroxyalkanoate synthesis repressor PhaR [Pseudomonadota bacterium]
MRIIKKYPNRRLYDTELSQYVKLTDIKKLVLSHIDFKTIDTRTDKEVTNSILLQIINEEESEQLPIFTTTMLKNMIRLYGSPLQKLISQFLEKNFAIFNQSPNDVKQYFKQYMGSENLFQTMADFSEKSMKLWQSMFDQYTHEDEQIKTKQGKNKASKTRKKQ